MFLKFKYLFYSAIALFLSLFIKRREKYIAFGAWEGRLYLDNSKYLLEYIRSINDGSYKLFWVGQECVKESLPSDVVFIKKNSFASIIPLLKCKYIFFSQFHNGDIAGFNVFQNAVTVFLDHGIGVKKWAMDAIGYDGSLEMENASLIMRIYGRFIGKYLKYTYIVSSSDYHRNTYFTSCKHVGANEKSVLKTGTPRNDILINTTEEKKLEFKEKYAQYINFHGNSKVIMYLPTFRRGVHKVESLIFRSEDELSRLNSILEKHDAVLIEKNHYAANKFAENSGGVSKYERLIRLNQAVDLQEMLLFTDVQISDFSGAFIDYLHLDRPIIHYLYDYDYYKNEDSGLYLEKEDFACGDVACNFDELCISIEKTLSGIDDKSNLRERGKKLFVEYEDGRACEKIFSNIIKNKRV